MSGERWEGRPAREKRIAAMLDRMILDAEKLLEKLKTTFERGPLGAEHKGE